VTSATASESGTYLFTAGKEGSIIKWDLATASRLHTFHKHRRKSGEKDPGEVKAHTDEVLALAISGDGKYLASAGKDRRILLWNIEKNEWVKGFGGHKDTISVSHPHISSKKHF
jgi:ribosomal RNA-processing protein 9